MKHPVSLSFRRAVVGLAATAGVALAPLAQAAIDTYMHIDGVVGDSTVIGRVGDIILTSYSQTFATKNCSRVVAVKSLDRASPALITRAAGNVVIPAVIISVLKAGERPVEFFKATLESVTIERVDVTDDGVTLREELVLKPRYIRIEYRGQDDRGTPLPPIVSTMICS